MIHCISFVPLIGRDQIVIRYATDLLGEILMNKKRKREVEEKGEFQIRTQIRNLWKMERELDNRKHTVQHSYENFLAGPLQGPRMIPDLRVSM